LLWPRADPWFTPRWLKLSLPIEVLSEDAYRFLAKWGVIAVIVVTLNYFFSKWVVFKKEKKA